MTSRTLSLEAASILTLVLAATVSSLFYNGSAYPLYEITVGLLTVACALALYRRSGSALPIGLPGLAFVGFFIWSALCVFWSQAPYVSMVELGSLFAGGTAYLTWRATNHDQDALPTRAMLLLIGGTLATVMLGQYLTGFRPAAMFLNQNSAAAMLNLAWPFAAIGWISGSYGPRMRLFLLFVAGLIFVAIGVTLSRGALLGSFAGIAVVAAAGFQFLHRKRPTLVFAITALAMLGVANLLADGVTMDGIRSISAPGSAGASRFTIWHAAWNMIQQHLWLGFGPGVFYLAYPAFRLPSDRSSGYFVHNDYLEFWLERGLIGLALVLVIGLSVCWLYWRYTRSLRMRSQATRDTGIAVATFAAFSTIAVHGVFSYSLQLMPFLIVLGVLLAEFERTTASAQPVAVRFPLFRMRILAIAGLFGLMLVPLWQVTAHALYFDRIDDGLSAHSQGTFPEAADSFAKARALWSLPDSAWYLQARTHLSALEHGSELSTSLKKELVGRALELLDEADERNPLRPATPMIRGQLRALYPDLTEGSAESAFRESLARDPRFVDARYFLSLLLERRGKTTEAKNLVERGVTMSYRSGTNVEPLIRRARELRRHVRE